MSEKEHRVTPGDVPTVVLDWGTLKWSVTPSTREGAPLSFGQVIVNPGEGHAPHVHEGSDEVIFVVSGEGVQTVADDEGFPIRPGDTVWVPRGAIHSTYNTGWHQLCLIVIYVPGGEEEALRNLPDFRTLPPGVSPAFRIED